MGGLSESISSPCSMFRCKNTSHFKTSAMGMDYYIIPEEETTCENSFSEDLSFFFEQVGGYGEAAEVEQVSRILQIDLSVFQKVSSPEEDEDYEEEADEEPSTIWHSSESVAAVVANLLAKIESFPDYYKQVLHNPDSKQDDESLKQLFAIGDEVGMSQQFEALQKKPLFLYPPDYGYLSQGSIVEDLKKLQQTLMCYQSKGITRFKLMYM